MAEVSARSYKDFTTRKVVLAKAVDRRLGHESPDPPDGWKWDYRYVIEDKIAETLPFPGLKKSQLGIIPRDYWQNGPIAGRTGDEVKVEEVVERFANGRTRWVPAIHNGDLNIWRDPTYFFSDDSVVETVSIDSIDSGGRSLHILQKTLRPGSPVLATIFRRDRDNEYLPWRSYTLRYAFSGLLDSNGDELTTRDGDIFYWSNVDTSKREMISYTREELVYLLFNQFVPELITSSTAPTVLDDFNDLEYLGDSDGTDSQKFYSDFFPVSNDSVLAVYAVDTVGGIWTQYSVVSEFSAANQVIVDYDIGSFTFGTAAGSSPPPTTGRGIYIAYRTVPRIEYEEDGYSEISLAAGADVSPLGQSINRGFITLSRAELDVDSIELTTTKESYSGAADTYGPVYVGADFAPLLATVYSSSGEVVPNVEVTFDFETSSPFGGIGGSATQTQRRTGFDGIARTYFVPPGNVDSMGYYVTTLSGSSTIVVPTDANFDTALDIYTYYVLKNDPLVGVPGADIELGEVAWDSTELNGRKVIAYKWDASAVNPISGHFGAYVPMRPTTITGGNSLTYSDTLETPDTSAYGGVAVFSSITDSGMDWIQDTSRSWTTNEWNSCVVYSHALGEYRRVRTNTSNKLTLVGSWSSVPTGDYSIFQRSSALGAYWIVSDRTLTLRASAYSPKLGRTIYSNVLNLRVEIPDYMKGSYINDSLQEIPFGWRIIDDTYEQASAINGATYISINPIAGPYPIVDIIGGETWDPYSGDDPYAFWPYDGYPGEGVSAPFAHFAITWTVA